MSVTDDPLCLSPFVSGHLPGGRDDTENLPGETYMTDMSFVAKQCESVSVWRGVRQGRTG